MALAGTPEFRLRDSLECISVDEQYFCPFQGWYSEPLNIQERVREADNDEGDLGFGELIQQLESLPLEEQKAALAEELNDAKGSAGKVLLDGAALEGIGNLDRLSGAFPEISPADIPRPGTDGGSSGHILVSSTSAGKQERSYWCGPASVAFMARHDPAVGGKVSSSQSTWAGYLGTTKAGTSIYNIKTQVNKRLTGWKNRVNGYVVKSVKGWSDGTWHTRFRDTVVNKRAPIVLHPKLSSKVSDYVPSGTSTGGHFSVAAGYASNGGQMKAWIFEPYDFGKKLTAKLVWDRVSMVKRAHDAHPQKSIAF